MVPAPLPSRFLSLELNPFRFVLGGVSHVFPSYSPLCKFRCIKPLSSSRLTASPSQYKHVSNLQNSELRSV